jgi:hypothetical protein
MTENYTMLSARHMYDTMCGQSYSFDPLTGLERWFLSDKLVYDIRLLPFYQSYCRNHGMTKLRDILTAINLRLICTNDKHFSKWIEDKLEKEQRMKIKSCKRG